MNLIFFGSPGVGKGTYAEIFSERLNAPHISTGDIFREEINKCTELGKQAKALIDQGKLCPDSITNEIVKKRLQQEDCKNGFILDGYPRNVGQSKALAAHTKIDKVLYFIATDETIIRRLTTRITCGKCQRIYNLITKSPKVDGKCDECGADIIFRDDQKPEAVKVRLEIYRKDTAPVIEFYRKIGVVREVDSNPEINEHRDLIISSIQKALDE